MLGCALLACAIGACSGEGDRSSPRARDDRGSTPTPSPSEITVPPGFDLPTPEGAIVRHAQAYATRTHVTLTTELEPDAVVALYTRAFEERGLRVAPQLDYRSREPGRYREVLQAFRADDDRVAAASATIERGPSGLTRVSLSQRRPDGPSFDSPVEPRAWRVVTRAPLPAPPGQAVAECAAALRRACQAWNAAGGPDALDCAMDHRGACVATDDEAYLRRSVEDARARLVAAHRAHDSVATQGARAETEAQLRLERLAAETVAYRAMSRRVELELVAPLLELVAQTSSQVRDARPSEWFPSPAAPEEAAPPDAPIPDWLRD